MQRSLVGLAAAAPPGARAAAAAPGRRPPPLRRAAEPSRAEPPASSASGSDGLPEAPCAEPPASSSSSGDELPEALQNLRLDARGNLVDARTGTAINEAGASRFDVAVRAMRGEFSAPPGRADTERAESSILDALVTFPAPHDFNFVLRVDAAAGATPAALAAEMAALVDDVCGGAPPAEASFKERKGGRFVSVAVRATVAAYEQVGRVFARLEGDARVVMKY
jgi:hypothetical protein